MEAKELMVGDLVCQKHSGLLLKVSKVNPPYIEAEGEGGEFHEDTIEPIPLTAKVLTKSGASKNRLMGEQRHFTYWLGGLNILAIYDADFSYQINGEARYLRQVHELQHVLKLLKIEKNIEL